MKGDIPSVDTVALALACFRLDRSRANFSRLHRYKYQLMRGHGGMTQSYLAQWDDVQVLADRLEAEVLVERGMRLGLAQIQASEASDA